MYPYQAYLEVSKKTNEIKKFHYDFKVPTPEKGNIIFKVTLDTYFSLTD